MPHAKQIATEILNIYFGFILGWTEEKKKSIEAIKNVIRKIKTYEVKVGRKKINICLQ